MNVAKNWLIKLFLFLSLAMIWLPAGRAVAEDYVIGIGDRLNISVLGEADLKDKGKVTVRPDGKISYPLIGEVTASGLTPSQLRTLLTKHLSEYYNSPQVTVNLIESNFSTVYIFGNVKAAGAKKLKGRTNLLQFFAMIGVLPDHIDLQSSFIVRNNNKLPVNLYGLLKEGDLAQNIDLNNGDTLFFKEKIKAEVKAEVKKEEKKEIDRFKNIIRIVGEVRAEKTIPYEKGITILDAIANAGGFTPYARPSGTKVVRRHKDKVEEILIDMDAVRDGAVDKNIPLEPGDLISVPASLF